MASTAGGSPSRAECASLPATFFTLLPADTFEPHTMVQSPRSNGMHQASIAQTHATGLHVWPGSDLKYLRRCAAARLRCCCVMAVSLHAAGVVRTFAALGGHLDEIGILRIGELVICVHGLLSRLLLRLRPAHRGRGPGVIWDSLR